MDFIWSGASAIGKWLVGSIPSELGYILSYEKNLKELETEVQMLEGTQLSVQHRVEEAIKNGEKIEDVVQNWQKEANGIVDVAKKLIDTEVGYCLGHCPNLWTRNRLSRGFEEMTQNISRIKDNGRFERISYRVPSEVTISPFCRGYQALVSGTSILNEIKEILKDPKMYMIGVYGMGGVGKTTLVNQLAWEVKEDGLFGTVVIADITNPQNVNNIQGQIAEALDLKFDKETKRGRATELRQRIKQEKSVLIILDNIWSELDFVEVGIPFGDEHNGCNVVVTSRDLNVLKRMGTQKEIYIRTLLEEDSWILFKKMAGDVVEEVQIKPIAEKMFKCCAGLPLLIKVVATNLRKKDVPTWRDALRQLERLEHEQLHNKVYPTLELSYNYLEDELKSVFLFIGSFGQNKIRTEELFSYCWGLGFYECMHTLTEARDRHHKLISDLRDSSMLLERELEYVRVHDVVLDVAKSIASNIHPIYAVERKTKLEEWPSVDHLKTFHYIIVPSSFIVGFPENLECPELKLLVLKHMGNYHLEVPDNFFSGMREVRVLILHGLMFTTSPDFNLLINLHSLSLCSCSLKDISMVAKLTNLEFLSLKDSSVEEPIPTHSFAKLKVIRVERCHKLINLLLYSPGRNIFHQLHEMEISYCGNLENIISMEKQKDENELLNIVLPELHSLTLSELPKLMSFYVPLTVDNSIPLAVYNQQVTRAMVKLQHLTIDRCSLPEEIFVQEKQVQFPNLETLHISFLYSLKSIWPYQVAMNSFCKLRRIYIGGCKSLVDYVFPISVAKELQQLQNLHISQCGITSIVEKSDSICDMTLVYLEIYDCQNMKTIVSPTVLFKSLEALYVESCDGVVNIITPSTITSLPKLRILRISHCYKLEEIWESSNEGDAPSATPGEIVFIKLKKLSLEFLPKLKCFCKGSYNFNFPSLQMVNLQACPLMETFSRGNLITPSLPKVQLTLEDETTWNAYYGCCDEWYTEYYWYEDLNTTVGTIFSEKLLVTTFKFPDPN